MKKKKKDKCQYRAVLIILGMLFMSQIQSDNGSALAQTPASVGPNRLTGLMVSGNWRLPVAGIAATLYNNLEAAQNLTNVEAAAVSEGDPEPRATHTLWLGWTKFESGGDSWSQIGGDDGHAYGRYQFDDRHCLAEFFRYCVNTDPDNYEAFTTFYHVDGNGKAHIKNTELVARDWQWICFLQGEDFHAMQTRFAVEYYYVAAVNSLLQAGVEVGGYSPILHGTILSLAIRDGIYASDLTAIIDTYYPGIDEETWLIEIYSAEADKHPDQAERWVQNQMEAALSAVADYATSPDGIDLSTYNIETIQLW